MRVKVIRVRGSLIWKILSELVFLLVVSIASELFLIISPQPNWMDAFIKATGRSSFGSGCFCSKKSGTVPQE